MYLLERSFFFFFNDTATTEIYTLSLHDALPICEMLDHGERARPYSSALEQQLAKIDDVERTPSARLIAEMRQTGETFFQLALRMSNLHKDYFLGLYPPNESRLAEFATEARDSHEAQPHIQASDTTDFDTYLAL